MKRTRHRKSRKGEALRNNEEPEMEVETHAALLNDVVLQNIFKYLGYKDLKSCRNLKNSRWLSNSNKEWWARSKVTISGSSEETRKVTDYFAQIEINSNAKNYKLKLFFRGEYNGFWERFGHSIKYLELEGCSFKLDDFRNVVFTQCPNLEKLVAHRFAIYLQETTRELMEWKTPQFGEQRNLKFLRIYCGKTDSLRIPWLELLSHFPKLEALEADTDCNIYKVISIIRKHDPKILKLNHIAIRNTSDVYDEDSFRRVLLDPNLKFETVRFHHEGYQSETVSDIVKLHAETLKELQFFGSGSRNPIQSTSWPPLHSLEKLTITFCSFTPDIFRCTPNVKKVLLHYPGRYNLLKNLDSHLRINTCKELELILCVKWKETPNSDFAKLLNLFPNVEILETSGLNNNRFSMICERWTKLVTLKCRAHCEVDTCGLLGFDPDSKTADLIRKPNITNLKGLQAFSLSSKEFRGKKCESRGSFGIEVKHGDVVLTELKGLTHLKMFELLNYKLRDEQHWKEIFTRYPGDYDWKHVNILYHFVSTR